jgi:hypothetical protein
MWMLGVYLVGVVVGLIATQGGPGTRLLLAVLWPLGPLAFVITVTGLLVVAAIAFPVFGLVLATLAAGTWWILTRSSCCW